METLAIPLPANLSPDICTEITKRACYCDVSIIKSRYRPDANCLEIDWQGPDHAEGVRDLTGKIESLIGKMQGERLAVQPRILRVRRRDPNTFASDIHDALMRRGDIWAVGKGTVARAGAFKRLLEHLDGALERIAAREFGAVSHAYNALLPSDWLRRAGYFASFAHSITFAVHLNEDFAGLERFSERHRHGEAPTFDRLTEVAAPEHCLSPAVCYHTYGALIGQQVPESGAVYTGLGRCFRYESKNLTGLDRLWEFSMREMVWLGEQAAVLAARTAVINLIWQLIEALDLSARLETACDPFFANDFPALRFFQLVSDLKYELQVDVDAEHSLACASFNYHEQFFGTRFDIRAGNGKPAYTVCAAFGLERLLYACFCQHGLERAEALIERAVATL
ncbi:MAG: aminoacyl--tRNA ligase-related protein [Acidiferrobacter sp.]